MRHVHPPYTLTRVTVALDTHLTASQVQCAFQDNADYWPQQLDSSHNIRTVTITERTVMRLTSKLPRVDQK